MITGIDESGDFGSQSKIFNYFVAVHIDQNSGRYLQKKEQFEKWEKTIPSDKKDTKGEIKGQLLTDNYIDAFYKHVLDAEPNVLYSVVRIIPAENSPEILEKHKQYEIKQFQQVMKQAEVYDHKNWAKGYKNILSWYNNRNYNRILKIKCLEHLLGISINQILGWSQISYILDNEDDSNIKNISFNIDKDIVKSDSTKILWGEIYRQFWQTYTKSDPIPLMDIWDEENHPVLKHYKLENGKLNLQNIFRQNTRFLDSDSSWEIRIADLVGTILHRGQNNNRCTDVCKEIEKKLSKSQKNYIHLKLK